MTDFVHLHVHSEYSPLDAPAPVDKLAKRAAELGYESLALTDHGTVGGLVKFSLACKKHGIKPILGIEAYFTPDINVRKSREDNYHLVLLAKSDEGIKNLFRMSQIAWEEGFYYSPRVDWDLLEKYRDGIVALSACVSGYVPVQYVKNGYDAAKSAAGRFKDIFGEDFYLEVQYHDLEVERAAYAGVAEVAAKNGIKLVGTNDVHYIDKGDADIQATLQTANIKKRLKDPKRYKADTNQMYLKSPLEMAATFGGANRQAAFSTLEIAEKCVGQLQFGKPRIPRVKMPSKFDDEMKYLEHLARIGLRKKGKEGIPEYEERFRMELDVIQSLKSQGYNFDRYFLIVAEYVDWAWTKDIRVGVGRGSGAGSLLLWCLNITGIDPLPYGLLFERFLAEDRNEPPDIDIDFDSERGGEVYQHVQEVYGADRCARIGTVGRYHAKSALRAAFRVFDPGNEYEKEQQNKARAEAQKQNQQHKVSRRGVKEDKTPNETVRMATEVSALLPEGPAANSYYLSKEKVEEKPDDRKWLYSEIPALRDWRKRFPELFQFAESIEDLVEKRSAHAAGVLITEDPTVELAPMQVVRAGGRNQDATLATAFDMSDVDLLGGIKFDFLYTKVLTVLSKTLKFLEEQGVSLPIDIDDPPMDDPETLKIFSEGDTLAIFQFESPGMQNLLKDMRPSCFEDIIAANALFRPGPMENIPLFVKRKKGLEKIAYPSPLAKKVLEPTYGVMVYQEQVMMMVRILAGFSGSEADKVRKAMGKKKKDMLPKLKEQFLEGCRERGTLAPEAAQSLWDSMEKFGSYAFNKSHSAGYSLTAYQCAYLKAHYPHEYMAAQLSVEGNATAYDTVEKYERGTRAMGIDIIPLDICQSKGDYAIEMSGRKKCLRRGFKGIKGVGESAWTDIVAGQPYRDMMDFCLRAGNAAKKDVVERLLEEGAFDCFKPGIQGRTGRPVSQDDLREEAEDRLKRAQKQRKLDAAQKEEREGIGIIFGFDDGAGDGNLAKDFRL